MILAYIKQLGLQVQKIDVRAWIINSWLLKTFGIVIAGFQIENKLGRVQFIQKWFLLANTSRKIVLKMPFLIFNNTNIQFVEKEFT